MPITCTLSMTIWGFRSFNFQYDFPILGCTAFIKQTLMSQSRNVGCSYPTQYSRVLTMTWIRFAIFFCLSIGLTMALPVPESNSDDTVVLHVEVPDTVAGMDDGTQSSNLRSGKTPEDHGASNKNHFGHPFSQVQNIQYYQRVSLVPVGA